jgi:hypothetical protein
VSSTAPLASSRYELSQPVASRFWALKALVALVLAVVVQDDPGYRGGYRYRVRDKETGEYVYEVTTSPGGVDAQSAEASIKRDLAQMTIIDFERLYRIDHTDPRRHPTP